MQTNNAGRELPKFTEVISIEIEVNSIHQKLMDTFPKDYAHKEILSHAIIGGAVHNGGLSYIFNALNGYTNDVDFSVGEWVKCSQNDRKEYYDSNLYTEDGKLRKVASVEELEPSWKMKWVPIGDCEVLEIDMYRNEKLKVEFRTEVANDRYEKIQKWVNHRKCTEMAPELKMPEVVEGPVAIGPRAAK